MARKTTTHKGYFLEHQGAIFGPVVSEKAAEELAIYLIAKNKNFEYQGHGKVSFRGEPPFVCKGEIVVHNETKELKRKTITRLYQLETQINPNAKQQQLLDKIIAEGEEIDPNSLQNKK